MQENGFGDSFAEVLIVMAIGTALILICGIAQLTYLYGLEKALEYGFWPFWPGALVKIVYQEFTKKLDTTDLESRLGLTGHPPSNHDGRQGGNDAPGQSFKNAA